MDDDEIRTEVMRSIKAAAPVGITKQLRERGLTWKRTGRGRSTSWEITARALSEEGFNYAPAVVSGRKAFKAAPGKVQSLGRIVSLRDHETETLSIPGVVTASAAWDLHEGVPAVLLRVLLEAGREAEFAAVRQAVAHAQRCRGPNRHPVIVQQALLRYVFCDVSYARDPSYPFDVVQAALRAALGLAGDAANARGGLFGLHARRLGAREYASRIEGVLQNVAGVLWCKVLALGRFGGGVRDPATLLLPLSPRVRLATLPCAPHELLQLAARHLTLIEAAEPSAGECA